WVTLEVLLQAYLLLVPTDLEDFQENLLQFRCLLSRVFSSNMERERRERRYKTSGLPLGSKNSLTCKRPRKSYCPQRSTSRLSSISRFSPGSMPRNQTNASVQDCEVFRMSGESLEEDPKSPCIPPPFLRKMYSDDDDPIIIKIKNRDQDGKYYI
ncbi:hypothetical protein Anas_09279, partial [Armadillidium nasatum]